MMGNMTLWNQVCKTDPADTKKARMKGGFNANAICAQSQIKKASEMFGPMGIGFGVKDPSYEVLVLSDDFHDSILVYKAVFWFNWNGQAGEFPMESDLDLWNYSTKYKSWSKANDPHKKVSTDALTKALSRIGFNADVFLGLFDDNKYVQEMRAEFKEELKKPAQVQAPVQAEGPPRPTAQELKSLFNWVAKAQIVGKDNIMSFVESIIGRPVLGSQDLYQAEVTQVITEIKRMIKDPAAVLAGG